MFSDVKSSGCLYRGQKTSDGSGRITLCQKLTMYFAEPAGNAGINAAKINQTSLHTCGGQPTIWWEKEEKYFFEKKKLKYFPLVDPGGVLCRFI